MCAPENESEVFDLEMKLVLCLILYLVINVGLIMAAPLTTSPLKLQKRAFNPLPVGSVTPHGTPALPLATLQSDLLLPLQAGC